MDEMNQFEIKKDYLLRDMENNKTLLRFEYKYIFKKSIIRKTFKTHLIIKNALKSFSLAYSKLSS